MRKLLFILLLCSRSLNVNAQQRFVGPVTITPATAASSALTLRAASSQSAALATWPSGSIDAAGALTSVLKPSGLTPGQLVYVNAAGNLASVFIASYDDSAFNIQFDTNRFGIRAELVVGGVGMFGEGIELANSAVVAVSEPGKVRLRSNGGNLQLSESGAAWADLTTGLAFTGAANQLTYWSAASTIGALGAATNGQLPIGSTGAAPVLAALTAGTAISVTNGAGSITIANTGVTSNVAGTGISVSGATGAVTVTNTAPHIAPLVGTTGAIGGGLLAAGACTSGTATVTGATTAMVAMASPVTYPGDDADWSAYVSAADTVTVKVCALVAVTPGSTNYNVRVNQ